MPETIEEATILLPLIIADKVIRESAAFVPQIAQDRGDLSRQLADRLANRAETLFFRNNRFAAKLKAHDGRDVLYAFMRHWLAGIIQREFGIRPPADFANGIAQ